MLPQQPSYNSFGPEGERETEMCQRLESVRIERGGRAGVFKSMEQSVGG